MSSGKQTDQDAFHYIVLTDDDFGDFAAHESEPIHRKFECRFGCHLVIVVQSKSWCCEVEREEKARGVELHLGAYAGLFADAADQRVDHIGHLAKRAPGLPGCGPFGQPVPTLHDSVV